MVYKEKLSNLSGAKFSFSVFAECASSLEGKKNGILVGLLLAHDADNELSLTHSGLYCYKPCSGRKWCIYVAKHWDYITVTATGHLTHIFTFMFKHGIVEHHYMSDVCVIFSVPITPIPHFYSLLVLFLMYIQQHHPVTLWIHRLWACAQRDHHENVGCHTWSLGLGARMERWYLMFILL